eukprot:jgi/Psemu1/7353/gm1.7353_g
MYKGFSSSKLLQNMILELPKMAMNGNTIIHFVWISGHKKGGIPTKRGQLIWKFIFPKGCGYKVQHISPYSQHAFVCPTLMTGIWRKHLSKAADAQITFVNRSTIWLTPGGRGGPHGWLSGNVQCVGCRKQIFWFCAIFPFLVACDLDNCLVDDELMDDDITQRFKNPHDRDHLMTPFQSKNCWLYNLKGRAQGGAGCPTGDLVARCIQQATLDTFWSQEQSTVGGNPESMNVAFAMILRSLDPGCNILCVQFETVRKYLSAFTSYFERMKDYDKMEHIIARPLFMNEEQNWRATTANLDGPFHDILKVVQHRHVAIIDSSMVVKDITQGWMSPPLAQTTIREPKQAAVDLDQKYASSLQHHQCHYSHFDLVLIQDKRHLEDGEPLHLPQGEAYQNSHGNICPPFWVDPEAHLLCEATGGGLLGYLPTGDAHGTYHHTWHITPLAIPALASSGYTLINEEFFECFTINLLKCEWIIQEIHFLGHWLTSNGIKPYIKTFKAILAMLLPKNLKQLRAFLGLAFEVMRTIVAIETMLTCPNHNLPFHIYTDASSFQLGTAIKQNNIPAA